MPIKNKMKIKKDIIGAELFEAKIKYIMESLEYKYKKNQLIKTKRKIPC